MNDDPARELSALASALHARVRARRRMGQRGTAALELQPAPAPQSARKLSPRRPDPRQPEPAPSPTEKRALSPAREAAQVQASELAQRAADCPDLASLALAVSECTACSLCRTRTQTVFADGKGRVRVLFVGEAPGENEDLQGVPFVGRAGALLGDIITKGMGLERQDVTIANVLKCRPPDNRDPSESEKLMCTSWLDRQIELLDPLVIIPLGRHAACHLLETEASMGSLRGRVHERKGRKIVPTYHPAYLLRSPGMKSKCWADIQLAMRELGIATP